MHKYSKKQILAACYDEVALTQKKQMKESFQSFLFRATEPSPSNPQICWFAYPQNTPPYIQSQKSYPLTACPTLHNTNRSHWLTKQLHHAYSTVSLHAMLSNINLSNALQNTTSQMSFKDTCCYNFLIMYFTNLSNTTH